MTFVFGLQTFSLIDFIKIYQLKGLKPKDKGHTNFYESCDLRKKVYLVLMYAEIPSRKSRWKMPEGATVSNFLKGWMQRCLRASPMRTTCKPQGIIITTTVRSRGRQGLNTPLCSTSTYILQPRWCWVASTTAPACMLVSQETDYRATQKKKSCPNYFEFFLISLMIHQKSL